MINGKSNNKDSRKILVLVVLIATIMISTTGATYAYFALSVAANNAANGTAATAELKFSEAPTLVYPTTASGKTTDPMVPQYSLSGSTNVLQKAVTAKCVDADNNVVCRTYKLTVQNTSSAAAVIKGQIMFNFTTYTNLKWKLMDSETAVTVASGNTGNTATKEYVDFATNIHLAVNATKQYYFIFWIEETGAAQNTTDKGTWQASFQFISNNGTGVTSTITS